MRCDSESRACRLAVFSPADLHLAPHFVQSAEAGSACLSDLKLRLMAMVPNFALTVNK